MPLFGTVNYETEVRAHVLERPFRLLNEHSTTALRSRMEVVFGLSEVADRNPHALFRHAPPTGLKGAASSFLVDQVGNGNS